MWVVLCFTVCPHGGSTPLVLSLVLSKVPVLGGYLPGGGGGGVQNLALGPVTGRGVPKILSQGVPPVLT